MPIKSRERLVNCPHCQTPNIIVLDQYPYAQCKACLLQIRKADLIEPDDPIFSIPFPSAEKTRTPPPPP